VSALDVPANVLIPSVAQELKANPIIQPPAWVEVVKTSPHNERPPSEPDFWFKRCASLLLTSYKRGVIGVRSLRRKYGGRTQHIVRRSHHKMAGGKIIRLALQQLEKANYMQKVKRATSQDSGKMTEVGRIITSQGRQLLDKTAAKLVKVVK